MFPVVRAALFYAGVTFAAGFVLGALRTLFVAPMIGLTLAVCAEVPVLLVLSWQICRLTLRLIPVPSNAAARLAMGAIALVLVLALEAVLSLTLGGLTLAQHTALYATPPVQIGLAAQVLFALFPYAQQAGQRV
jgi:hypothetical protein